MVASGCAAVNFAVDTGVAARYESVGLGYIGQAGLSGSREKAYMAYRRARWEHWGGWPSTAVDYRRAKLVNETNTLRTRN